MIVVDSISNVAELHNSQEAYMNAERENLFGQELLKQAIRGRGSETTARHKLQLARAEMAHSNQKEVFWNEMLKQELGGYKKAWELIKE